MNAPALDVDVVIVAHNAGELLREAVSSAADQADPARVWVVDAESTDGSVAAATARFPEVAVVSAANDGFAASNNVGIAQGAGRWALLLNPDARLEEGALGSLLLAGESDDRVAVVGALVLNPDGTAQANQWGRFPTFARMLALRAWRLWSKATGNRTLSPRVPDSTAERDWVTGACMLVRRAAIEDAGPMDEGFFLYYEDVEWCHRMRDRGWRVVVEPTARVIHHLGGAAVPSSVVARAYRESLDRYCDLYGLWGLKLVGRVAGTAKGTGR